MMGMHGAVLMGVIFGCLMVVAVALFVGVRVVGGRIEQKAKRENGPGVSARAKAAIEDKQP